MRHCRSRVFGVAVACSSATSRIARSGQRSDVRFWGYFMVFEDHKGYKGFWNWIRLPWRSKDDETLMTLKTLPSPQQMCCESCARGHLCGTRSVYCSTTTAKAFKFLDHQQYSGRWPMAKLSNVFHTTGHQNRWFWSLQNSFTNSHIHLTDSQTKSFRRTCANQSFVVICPVKCLACNGGFPSTKSQRLTQSTTGER